MLQVKQDCERETSKVGNDCRKEISSVENAVVNTAKQGLDTVTDLGKKFGDLFGRRRKRSIGDICKTVEFLPETCKTVETTVLCAPLHSVALHGMESATKAIRDFADFFEFSVSINSKSGIEVSSEESNISAASNATLNEFQEKFKQFRFISKIVGIVLTIIPFLVIPYHAWRYLAKYLR